MSWMGRAGNSWRVNTPDQVGPGAYQVSNQRQSKYGSAPFDSCEPRMSTATSQNSPDFYIGHKSWTNKSRCSSAFGSRAVRLADIKTISPGPGAYNISSKLNKSSRSEKSAHSPFGVYRTSVSIPSREVQPMNIGPGTYNPHLQDSSKGTNFGASVSKRAVFDQITENLAGPGYYSSIIQEKPKSGWMFNSNSKRPLTRPEKNDMPGPGSYQISLEHEVKSAPVGFGSNTKRDIKVSNDPHRPFVSNSSTTPAVGTYLSREEQDKIDKLKKKLISNDCPVEKAPFGTTDKRINENISNNPGPGYYQPTIIGPNLNGFVPKSSRFNTNSSVTPGPGAYSPMSAQSKKTQKFTSHGPRFKKDEEKPSQSHLNYSKHSEWHIKQTRYPDYTLLDKNLSFDTTGQRFVLEKSLVPGPGQYETRSMSAPRKASNAGNAKIGHRDLRPNTGTPLNIGPGTYNIVDNPRKTFNMAKDIGKDNVWL